MMGPMIGHVTTMVAAQELEEKNKPKTVSICTCGARAFEEAKAKRKQQRSGPQSPTQAKRAAYGAVETPEGETSPKRSLWRKILGKGPKCTCGGKSVELVVIPSEYVGVSRVCVSGKRVPFSRDMTQKQRASWNPLDAIEEDE